MAITAFSILVVIALILAILSLVKPQWPLLGIAVVLLSVALLIQGR